MARCATGTLLLLRRAAARLYKTPPSFFYRHVITKTQTAFETRGKNRPQHHRFFKKKHYSAIIANKFFKTWLEI